MKRCQICSDKIKNNNNGLSDLLDNSEIQKVLKLRKDQTICIECKKDLLYADIINPFF